MVRKPAKLYVKMKMFLLSLTVVLTCVVATESAHIPSINFMRELDDLRESYYLEHQEQGITPDLNCSTCVNATSEAMCTAMQVTTTCPADFSCGTVSDVSTAGAIRFTRECLPNIFCANICPVLNETGTLLFCSSQCCNTTLCNAGVLPTTSATTTPATTTPATTMPATTTPATTTPATTMPATTTPATTTQAPTTPAPTTPVVCGGPLVGVLGSFTSPGFPGSYPNNVNCPFTFTIPAQTVFVITFSAFNLAPGDFLRIVVSTTAPGGTLTLTGEGRTPVFSIGKRSLDDKPEYYGEFVNDDDDYYYDDDVEDGFYYYYDGRRREDDDNPIFFNGNSRTAAIRGQNQPISIVFSSNAAGSASGFSAAFQDQNLSGSGSESGGGSSSDEEE